MSRKEIQNRRFIIVDSGYNALCEDGTFKQFSVVDNYKDYVIFNHIDDVSYRLLKLRVSSGTSNYSIAELDDEGSWVGFKKIKGKPSKTNPKPYFNRVIKELNRL